MKNAPIEIVDPGLQPERTIFAWNRTMVSFLVVSAVFLRWLPHYGMGVILLIAVSSSMAFGILLSQRARYRRMALGLKYEKVRADVVAVLMTTLTLVVLGGYAIFLVLAPK